MGSRVAEDGFEAAQGKEARERIDPRPKALLPAPPSSPKAEDQGEGSREKTAGKKAHDPNAVWFRQGLAYVANNRYDSAIGAFTLALTADRRDASSYTTGGPPSAGRAVWRGH